jgi:[protein-PII] uridylyltransferase
MTPHVPAIKPESRSKANRSRVNNANSWQRERLYAQLRDYPITGVPQDEVNAHFERMPSRYWKTVTKSELVWGLQTIHTFFENMSGLDRPETPVFADWQFCPERAMTKIMVCTWDRPGLLAKMAAAFGVLRMNLLKADVFTRLDNVVLDVFHISELDDANNSQRMRDLIFLLEGALNDPPRFVSLWATEFHKSLVHADSIAPSISFDNQTSSEHTIIGIEVSDRIGLLFDLLQALGVCSANIDQAVVETEEGIARDLFYVTDLERRKIIDPTQLTNIRKALIDAIKT